MEWEYLPDVSSAYDDKVSEIKEYLHFLKILTAQHSYVSYQESTPKSQAKRYKPTPIDTATLRSSAILLIYNFIESISCALMRDIHEDLSNCYTTHKNKNVSWTLSNLNSSLRSKIIDYASTKGNIKNCITEYLEGASKNLDTQIILHWLEYTKQKSTSTSNQNEIFNTWFSGNVDVRKIKEIISPYGISSSLLNEICNASNRAATIRKIKEGRNNLAHGQYTFTEYGKTKTVKNLEADFECVKEYFEELLDLINGHLKNRGYLENLNQ